MLASYPGFPRTAVEMHNKTLSAPKSQGYCFGRLNNAYLDPTYDQGELVERKLWFSADTTMACVNDPPPGYQKNVSFGDGTDDLDVLFIAHQDIAA